MPERYGHTMKQSIKRRATTLALATVLATVTLSSVACTRNMGQNTDTTTQDTTKPATTTTEPATTTPLDPNAGTVAPNGDAGDPPANSRTPATRYRRGAMH